MSTIVRGTIGHIFSDCTMDIRIAYGEKVKTVRKSLKVSQEHLAELSNLDRTYISDIENGKRNVSIETAYKIAKALKTPLPSFFDFETFN